MFLGPFVAPLDEGTNGGRGGVEDVNAILFDDAPEAVLARMVRGAFIHQCGRAVAKRAVDDVAMAGDPTDVGRAPIRVVLAQIEHPLVGERGSQQVTRRGVQHALRLAGRAAGVKDVKGMLAVERHGGAVGGSVGHQFVPPEIAARLHFNRLVAAIEDDAFFDGG